MGAKLCFRKVIFAPEHKTHLTKNKWDDFLERFRGVGKRALQKLRNGLVGYQLKIVFQLRILKGETYINFKNFVGPVFTPQKRLIRHFYTCAYFCQICFVNLVVMFQLYLHEYRNIG